MEKLLEKLGAPRNPDEGSDAYTLTRVSCTFYMKDAGERYQQWLLIGEITEALREVNCCTFEAHCDDCLGWKLIVDQRDSLGRYQPHNYIADTLMDCYIKAGEELL